MRGILMIAGLFAVLSSATYAQTVCQVSQGCTGATTSAGALANLGAQPLSFTNTADPPSQTCSSLVNQFVFATSTTSKLYQCIGAAWGLVGGGSGSGTVAGQASGVIPLATGSTTIGAQSALSDNGSTITSTESISTVGINSTITSFVPGSPAGEFDQTSPVLTDYDASVFTGTNISMTVRYMAFPPFTVQAGQTSFEGMYAHVALAANTLTSPASTYVMDLWSDSTTSGHHLPSVCLTCTTNAGAVIASSYQPLNYIGASNPFTPNTPTEFTGYFNPTYSVFAFSTPQTFTPGTIIHPVLKWYSPATGPTGTNLVLDGGTQTPSAPGIQNVQYETSSDGVNWTYNGGTGLWYQLVPFAGAGVSVTTPTSVPGIFNTVFQGMVVRTIVNTAGNFFSEQNLAAYGGSWSGGGGYFQSDYATGLIGVSEYQIGAEALQGMIYDAGITANNPYATMEVYSALYGTGSTAHTGPLNAWIRGGYGGGATHEGPYLLGQFGKSSNGLQNPVCSLSSTAGNVVTASTICAVTSYSVSGGLVTLNGTFSTGLSGITAYFSGFTNAGTCNQASVLNATPANIVSSTTSYITVNESMSSCTGGSSGSWQSSDTYVPGQSINFAFSGSLGTLATAMQTAQTNGGVFVVQYAPWSATGIVVATNYSGFAPGAISSETDAATVTPAISPYPLSGIIALDPDCAPGSVNFMNTNLNNASDCDSVTFLQDQSIVGSSNYYIPNITSWRGYFPQGSSSYAMLTETTGDGISHASGGFEAQGAAIVNTGNVLTDAATMPGLTIGNIGAPSGVATTYSISGGSLSTGTYYYKVYATTPYGTTPSSSEVTRVLPTTSAGRIFVRWTDLPGASSYTVCGRASSGGELKIATVTNADYYIDTGSISPSGSCPSSDTSGGNLSLAGSTIPLLLNGSAGTSNQCLISNGAGATPSWSTSCGSGATTGYALTMNNSGSGAASGTTFNGSAAETISYNTVGAAPAIAAAVVRTYCTGTTASSSTIYFFELGTTTTTCTATGGSATSGFLATRAGTLKNLTGLASTGGVNSSSGVMTLYDNTTSTGITCTFGTGTTCTDTTHTYTTTAGHYYFLKMTSQATETLANLQVSFDFQ